MVCGADAHYEKQLLQSIPAKACPGLLGVQMPPFGKGQGTPNLKYHGEGAHGIPHLIPGKGPHAFYCGRGLQSQNPPESLEKASWSEPGLSSWRRTPQGLGTEVDMEPTLGGPQRICS